MRQRNIGVIVAAIASIAAHAQSPVEILRTAEDLLKGKSCRAAIEMTIVTPDYTRTLSMKSWWIGNEKALISITGPAREAGNKTLKIGNEMWTYLRATETTIKVPPSMMLQSWNGSDFTNDDLVRESDLVRDYDVHLLGEEPIAGVDSWKIELVPKAETAVVWGRLYYWVRKTDRLPALVQYYDEKGMLARWIEYSEYRSMHGRRIPTKWSMVNKVKKGNRTEMSIGDIAFDVPIPDGTFSLRELER